MRPIGELLKAYQAEAERESFPIDVPIYESSGRSPTVPILYVGNLGSPICILGRDLGKDEVAAAEPLIGAGGRLVRTGLYKVATGSDPDPNDRKLTEGLALAVMTNTVPFKPPGNKAYSDKVKDRFRPLLLEFFRDHWRGRRIITLGNEAFQWFEPHSKPGSFAEFWELEDRYERSIECTLPGEVAKSVSIEPLPHPSPLNARWFKRFPELLENRLRLS